MKTKRHEAILEIISKNAVTTQEGLQEALRGYGFEVTQATVSRDIKSLDLVKVLSEDGKYCYAQKFSEQDRKRSLRYRSIFMEAVISVDYGQNIVAVKCHVGMGNAACAAIDLMALPDIVGTLAGDDTVFILMRNTEQAAGLTERIRGMLG